MRQRGALIFLLMQVCFVVAGFALYFGLKSLKEEMLRERAASVTAQAQNPADEPR